MGTEIYGPATQHPHTRETCNFSWTAPALPVAPVADTHCAPMYHATGMVLPNAWANVSSESVASLPSSQSSDDSVSDASSVMSSDSASTVSSQSSMESLASYQSLDAKMTAAMSWRNQQRAQAQQHHLQKQREQQQQQQAQMRQHPRRTATAASVPSLVRQSDRRNTFVDHLVDASAQVVQAIWPLSSVIGRTDTTGSGNISYLLPLRTFIQETLRRSRASYSTLQVALYYLLLIKPHLPAQNFTTAQTGESHGSRALQCGRRMFLTALILASKYLQDRNYSARAWSKISGLATEEINHNETSFLFAVNWRMHITTEVYSRWIDCVNKFKLPQMPLTSSAAPDAVFERKCADFRDFIQKLSPTLDNLDELNSAAARASLQLQTAYPLSPVSLCSSPQAMSSPMTPPSAMATVRSCSPCVVPSQASTRASQMLAGSRTSMGFAVAQSSHMALGLGAGAYASSLDRWPTMSPTNLARTRRSSLANSVSTVSSPESMVSDSSLLSRTSTASSEASWSAASAHALDMPIPTMEPVQARRSCSFGPKQHASMSNLREQYTFGMAARHSIPPMSDAEAATAAAIALAEMHHEQLQSQPRPSLKRSRPSYGESALQDNVRSLLCPLPSLPEVCSASYGLEDMVEQAQYDASASNAAMNSRVAGLSGSRKRLRLGTSMGAGAGASSAKSLDGYSLNLHRNPASTSTMPPGPPGMM